MADAAVTLRLTIVDPVPGVRYSLQDKANIPQTPMTAQDTPLSFDVPVRLSQDGRWLGDYVRREGTGRRFIYIAIGTSAGDHSSPWARRAKIDIHEIPAELLDLARQGRILEVRLPGHGKDGTPACATVRPIAGWQAL